MPSQVLNLSVRLLLGMALLLPLSVVAQTIEDEWQGVARIIVVGDIHGDYDNYRQVLRDAGVINRRGNWIAEDAHFVQLGDLPDRGPDTDEIIEHMQRLEEQAIDDGGRVHALIGNHEAMNMLGDLRYVHPGEYAAFRTRQSRNLRDQLYMRHIAQRKLEDEAFSASAEYRQRFNDTYPLGFVEHRLAWRPEGEIGAWVVGHNTIIKINRVLFLHAGISPALLGMSMREINEQVRAELNAGLGEEEALAEREDGPLWYRGMSTGAEELEADHVELVLAQFDVDRIVVGHQPGLGTVVPRFDGRVIVADTGISSYYGGHLASVEITDGQVFVRQHGEILPLPANREELYAYYRRIYEFEEGPPALEVLMRSLLED